MVESGEPLLINQDLEEAAKKFDNPVVVGEAAKSWMGAPMIVGGEVKGVISIQHIDRENAFLDSDLRLLATLANSMSVALENARLFDETQRLLKETEERNSELAVINSIQEGVAAEMEFQTIVDLVGDKLREVLKTDDIGIRWYDYDQKLVHYLYEYEHGDRLSISPAPSVIGWEVITSRREPDVRNTSEEVAQAGTVPGTDTAKSNINVSIIGSDRVLGSIVVEDFEREHAFSDSDIRLLTTVASSMGVALENARLFDETQRLLNETEERNEELAIINSISQALSQELDLQSLIDLVGDKIRTAIKSENIGIGLYDKKTNLLTSEYVYRNGERVYPDPTPFNDFNLRFAKQGKPLVLNDVTEKMWEKLGSNLTFGNDVPQSVVMIPFLSSGELIGGITLQDFTSANAYPESMVRLLETIASNMGTAIQNARLFEETQNLLKETEERNAELAVINSVQEGLASKLDMQAIYDLVGDKISEITDSEIVVINTWNKETKKIRYEYIREKGERFEIIERPFSPLTEMMLPDLEKGKTIVHNDGVAERLKQYNHTLPVGEMPLSVVTIPLKTGDKINTAISLQDTQREYAFSESTIRLVETLARSMGIALENARLFDETTQRNAELAIVNSVSEAMSQNLDVNTVVKIVGDKVQQIFSAEMVAIGFINEEKGITELPYSYSLGEYFEEESFPLGEGLAGIIFKTRQPLVLNTAEELVAHGTVETEADRATEKRIESWMGVPIIIGDKLIGGVAVQSYKPYAYDDRDLRLLSTLAANMGAVIENARLFDETKHLLKETEERNAELAVINSVQEALAAQLDLQGIYDAVGDKIRDIFDAQSLVIGTLDYETRTGTIYYGFQRGERVYPEPIPFTGLTDRIIQTGEKIVINDNMAERHKEFGMVTFGGEELTKSGVWIPYKIGNQVRGIISLQNMDREHAFSESDVRLLETLASSMSVALENARLFDELQSSNTEILEALERQTAISEILNIISNSPGEIQPVLQAVAEHAATLCEADDVQIYRAVDDQIVEIAHFGPLPALRASETLPLDPGLLTGRSIIEKRTIHIDAGNISAEEYPISVDLQTRLKHRSVIITPLIREDLAIGAIVARRNKVQEFSKNQIDLLSTFANQAAIAIENVRLFEETRRLLAESMQQADELQTVNTVSMALSSELELDALIELIGNQVQKIFNADIAYLALLEKNTGYIEFPFSYGEEIEKIRFGEGLTSRVIKSGEPLLINQDEEWSKTQKRIGVKAKSYLGVPISVGKDVTGVISVQSTQWTNMYEDRDAKLLSTIAANIGAAIHNAQLYKEIEQRAEEMATLAEIGSDIASTHDLDSTLQKIAERAKRLLKVGDIALYLVDDIDEKIVPRVVLGEYVNEIMASPISIGDGISGHVVQTGIAELVNYPKDHPYTITVPGTPEFEEEPEGLMSAPLISGGKVIGLINVWRKHSIGLFSEEELDFLVSVARQTAIAIESARLYLETEHHAEQMSTLESVGREISSDLDLQSVLERIGERALNLLQGKSVAIRLLDDQGDLLPVVALGDYSDQYMNHKIQFGEGITGDVAQTGRAEIINQPLEDTRLKLVPGTGQADSNALIISPLTISDSVIGTLSIWRDKIINGRFVDSDLNFAVGLARQAAIAITNANLFKEVERQKEYFEMLISSAPVAIVTIDLDGNVTGWSPAAVSLFGYTAEEAIGKNIDALVAKHEDVREEAEYYTEKFLVDIGKMQVNTKRTHKDGHLIDVGINAMPVHIEGELSGYIAIYNDVSELEKARRDAEEANHAKSAFLANMSHELRTPLNAIIGFTRIVKRKGEKVLPEKQLENLDKVLVSAEHLLGLINTVLDISKIEAGRMEVHTSNFDLKSLINLVAVTTQPLVRQGAVELITDIPDDLPMVNSDIEKIKQVVINLISNAAKFTHKGEIRVKVAAKNDQIMIDVVDTGIGIPPDALENIFEEFQQADSSTTPLILVIDDNEDAIYLMRETLESAGYQVAVARDGEEGLSLARELNPFVITLDIMMPKKDVWQVLHDLKANPTTKLIPVILISIVDQKALGYRLGAEDYLIKPLQEDEILRSLEKLKDHDGERPVKRLLVVDDDPNVLDMVSQLLEGKHYVVEGAADGIDALEKLKTNKPDAILLDLMMPRLDGFGFIEQIKQDPTMGGIPIIVLTAKLLEEREKNVLKRSVGQVIQKQGISGEDLLNEISETIRTMI
ncbi:MAG: GAF domain-containing protein [Anaerolineales bacterium]